MNYDEWKDIPGFENLYSVNHIGDIYSHYTNRILKPSISTDGYKQCVLYKDKKPHIMCNHKAVALAYIANDDKSLVVNHIDENKINCSVENLEWVTRKQNNEYMGNRAHQGLFSKAAKNIYAYDSNLNLIDSSCGINKYALEHGLNRGCLCGIINENKTRTENYRTYRGIIYTDNPLTKTED